MYYDAEVADRASDSAFGDDAHYYEFEEEPDDELNDQDDCTKCVLSLVAVFARILDRCHMMTFYRAFRIAFRNLTEISAFHKVFNTSAARLLLASHLPRRLVLELGSIIKVTEDLREGEDPPNLRLVKEWDRLRLDEYQQAQRAKAEADEARWIE